LVKVTGSGGGNRIKTHLNAERGGSKKGLDKVKRLQHQHTQHVRKGISEKGKCLEEEGQQKALKKGFIKTKFHASKQEKKMERVEKKPRETRDSENSVVKGDVVICPEATDTLKKKGRGRGALGRPRKTQSRDTGTNNGESRTGPYNHS